MNYLLPEFLGLPEEPTSSIQAPPTDGNSTLSPAGVMYSTLLQLRTHVETEKLELTTLKQLVQRLQRDFALLQSHIEVLGLSTTTKSSPLVSLENKFKILESVSPLKRADTIRGLIPYNMSYLP